MHAHGQTMANQNGRNGSTHDDKEGWRNQGGPPRGRDEDWEDAEGRGAGQSGYVAGRSSDDRSIGTQVRNTGWSRTHDDRGTDDRFTGRGGRPWQDERGEREYGRGTWEEGRMGMSQGYGYQDGDRPSFEHGMHEPRFGGLGPRDSGGPYGGGGYEPDRRSVGNREQERHGSMGYGGEGRQGYGEDRAAFSRDQGAYRQDQSSLGGAQGLHVRRGPHRGKGPKGFEPSDERIRERVCEALSDDHNVDASNIEVSVNKGEVTLTGTVNDRETKRMAEDCVLQCSGVRDVHNQLRVHH